MPHTNREGAASNVEVLITVTDSLGDLKSDSNPARIAMLVRFTVENYLSFHERVELSMVASKKVRRHPEHVVKPSTSSGIPLLKLAVLYGANASGKSNLIKAMAFASSLVARPIEVDRSIQVTPFKLDPSCREKPSRFEFEIKVGERYYSYGFSLTSKKVEEEWLFEIDQNTERKVFERTRGKIDFETEKLDPRTLTRSSSFCSQREARMRIAYS